MRRPTFKDILEARKIVNEYLPSTPLHYYPSLSKMLGFEVYIKHENHQPVGAFKVRGGINLISRLSKRERTRGVIAASTGNHGQSVAYAAKTFAVKATIVVPEKSNPDKVEAIRNLGANVLFHGADYEQCKRYTEALAQDQGYRYISAGDEPLLIAGVGTYALEILEDLPDTDVIVVPIGGGSGACGNCIVAKSINPAIKVIGVQAEKAPAVYLSWKQGRRIETPSAETFAEGLATRTPFALPLSILRQLIDDIVLVSEEEMRSAIRLLLEKTHNLAEGAGAASTAAAVKLKDSLKGQKVVLVLSGGNLTIQTLKEILEDRDLQPPAGS